MKRYRLKTPSREHEQLFGVLMNQGLYYRPHFLGWYSDIIIYEVSLADEEAMVLKLALENIDIGVITTD